MMQPALAAPDLTEAIVSSVCHYHDLGCGVDHLLVVVLLLPPLLLLPLM
jgi:hypothetical protein